MTERTILCASAAEGEDYRLLDLGSFNGTTIDGTRQPEAVLEDGMLIYVGATSLIWRTGEQDVPAAPRPSEAPPSPRSKAPPAPPPRRPASAPTPTLSSVTPALIAGMLLVLIAILGWVIFG